MAVHFDPPSLNIYCEGVVGPRNFKLGGVIEKSYGFTFVGPVSMETLLTFEPAVFVKITKILTSPIYIPALFFPSYHIRGHSYVEQFHASKVCNLRFSIFV